MAWTTLSFPFGSVLTSAKMTQLYDNFTAMANGDSGAPAISYAALSLSNDLTQGDIASSAIGQGELKTASTEIRVDGASGEVTTSSSAGRYAFAWQSFEYSGNEFDPVITHVAQGNNAHTFTTAGAAFETKPQSGSGRDWWRQFTIGNDSLNGDYDGAVRELYVQSSPPYELDNQTCGLFMFALINKNGEVMASSIAPDPCWSLNGPTILEPKKYVKDKKGNVIKKFRKVVKLIENVTVVDFEEITPQVKNRDMHRLPHPFIKFNKDFTPVLLDPASDIAHQLIELHEYGEVNDKPSSLLKHKHIQVTNTPAGFKECPSGLLIPNIKWKNTGARK